MSPYCRGENPARRLKVGLVLESEVALQEPRGELIAALLAADFVDVTHVIELRAPLAARAQTLHPAASLLMRLYGLVDRKLLAASLPVGSCSLDSLRERLSGCRWLPLTAAADGRLSPTNARDTLPEDLDLLVCAGAPGSGEALSSLARAGVWWVGPLEHPEAGRIAAHLLLATAAADAPLLDAVWALRPGQSRPEVREMGTVRRMSRVSVKRNLEPMRKFGAHLLLAAVRRLSLEDEDEVAAAPVADAPPARNGATGSSLKLAATIAVMAARHFGHRLATRDGVDLWHIGIRERRADPGARLDPGGYRWVASPSGSFWADPFLFEHDGRTWLFYEHIANPLKKANLACAELLPDGTFGPGQVILDKPYHLSYPQVFASGGEIFLMPESGSNHTVELYRAVSFPYRWELVRVLQRGRLYDTTLHMQDGRFWFFTSLSEDGQSAASQLLLFSSDRVDGDWRLHPRSPISADARFARNAGALFVEGGHLVRPAQDCSATYGGAVEYRRVQVLNEREYREASDGSLRPALGSGSLGIHTYNRTARVEVIDSKRVGGAPDGRMADRAAGSLGVRLAIPRG